MKKIILLLAFMSLLSRPFVLSAQEAVTVVDIPQTEVTVDQNTGDFEFEIRVNAEEKFAGLEFGAICAPGCEITKVEYSVEASATGPVNSQGLTWFGFFDGTDSFNGQIIVSVQGKCETNLDSAISFQEMKKYMVGDEEFKEEYVSMDTIVNLRKNKEIVEIKEDEVAKESGINAEWQMMVGVVIAAVAVGALVYIFVRSKRTTREEKSE